MNSSLGADSLSKTMIKVPLAIADTNEVFSAVMSPIQLPKDAAAKTILLTEEDEDSQLDAQ